MVNIFAIIIILLCTAVCIDMNEVCMQVVKFNVRVSERERERERGRGRGGGDWGVGDWEIHTNQGVVQKLNS